MAEIFWSELTKIAVKMKQTHHPNSKMCWYQKSASDSRCQRAQMFHNLVPSWFKTTQKCIFRQISHTWHEFFKVYIYDFSSIFLNQNKGGCVIFENKSSEHLQLKSKGLFWKFFGSEILCWVVTCLTHDTLSLISSQNKKFVSEFFLKIKNYFKIE